MGEGYLNFDRGSAEVNALNWLSIACSSTMLATIFAIKITRPEYLNRVSLRIQVAIAGIDIVRHLNRIYSFSSDEKVCAIWGFLFFFSYHATTFLNVAIAANLQIIYLHEKIPPKKLGFFLCAIPLSFSLVLDLIPLVLKAYGRSKDDSCFLSSSYEYRDTAKLVLLFISIYPGLIYCFIIPVLLMVKLLIIETNVENPPQPSRFHDSLSRTLAFRISLYPLACSLCHFGSMIYSLNASYLKISGTWLQKWTVITLGCNGIINFLCFLIDPFILEAFKSPWATSSLNPQEIHRDDTQEDSQEDSQALEPKTDGTHNGPNIIGSRNESEASGNQPGTLTATPQRTAQSEIEATIRFENPQEKSEPSSSNAIPNIDSALASPPRGRCHVQPIPIPGAKDPNKEEVWHTTDLHLDWRHLYKFD